MGLEGNKVTAEANKPTVTRPRNGPDPDNYDFRVPSVVIWSESQAGSVRNDLGYLGQTFNSRSGTDDGGAYTGCSQGKPKSHHVLINA